MYNIGSIICRFKLYPLNTKISYAGLWVLPVRMVE